MGYLPIVSHFRTTPPTWLNAILRLKALRSTGDNLNAMHSCADKFTMTVKLNIVGKAMGENTQWALFADTGE